jgi:hypothetical protein
MYPELYSCCKKQPSWIFVYENNTVYNICKGHFTSVAHREFVKYIINLETGTSYLPSQVFVEVLA